MYNAHEIRVLELGGSLPGALCGSHLGSLGMRVTAWRKDPEQTAEVERWLWDWSKERRQGEPTDQDLANADLIIDGRPIDAPPLEVPGVVCRILGDWDLGIEETPEVVLQATVGLVGYVGRQSEAPIVIGTPVITFSTGVAAVQASAAGLVWSRKFGRPCIVTVTAVGVGVTLAGNNVTSESDPDAWISFAKMPWDEPATGFACADGSIEFSFGRDDDSFQQFVSWLGSPELATDEAFATRAARNNHLDELNAALRSRLTSLKTDDVLAELDKVGALWARRWEVADLPEHPQLEALGLLTQNGSGTIVQLPFLLDHERPRSVRIEEGSI